MFLSRGRDKIIRDIEKRIADFTFIPVGMAIDFFVICSEYDMFAMMLCVFF